MSQAEANIVRAAGLRRANRARHITACSVGWARCTPRRDGTQRPTRLYCVWMGMRKRCHQPSNRGFPDYGARGIRVCDEWRYDYAAFRAWAVANGFRKGLSLDRINNDGNYEPGNCRWATSKQQSRNTRATFRTNGVCASAIAETNGIGLSTFWTRIQRGWSVERATTCPVQKKGAAHV